MPNCQPPPPPPPPEESPRESGDMEYIHRVKIINDYENWLLEPAEIRVRVYAPNYPASYIAEVFIGDPEPEDEWHTINQQLLRWYHDDYGDYLVLDWYEHDNGSTINIDFTLRGINFSGTYTNDDDPMGRKPVNVDDPKTTVYDTGDVEWRNRWQ